MQRWDSLTDAEVRAWQARAARSGRTRETGRAVLGWLLAFGVSTLLTVLMFSAYFRAFPWEW